MEANMIRELLWGSNAIWVATSVACLLLVGAANFLVETSSTSFRRKKADVALSNIVSSRSCIISNTLPSSVALSRANFMDRDSHYLRTIHASRTQYSRCGEDT